MFEQKTVSNRSLRVQVAVLPSLQRLPPTRNKNRLLPHQGETKSVQGSTSCFIESCLCTVSCSLNHPHERESSYIHTLFVLSRQIESDDSSDSELVGPPPPPALSTQADDDDEQIGPPLPPGFSRTTADDDDDDDDTMQEDEDDVGVSFQSWQVVRHLSIALVAIMYS